ncbi:hypothetical protein BC832DRAFT_546605 [Gaertneriomyces semiglobifer]|nr:hypothetical protein BC832DRAFT_546605 [Gaertneriomyces semiglobifer]
MSAPKTTRSSKATTADAESDDNATSPLEESNRRDDVSDVSELSDVGTMSDAESEAGAESRSGDSDEDPQPQAEDDDDDEEEEEYTTGNKRRRQVKQRAPSKAKQTKQPAKKRATRKRQDAEIDFSEGSLFEIVSHHPSAIEPQIADWVTSYSENPNLAMVDLINFLITSSGCPGKITPENVEDQDGITDVLKELQGMFDIGTNMDYPIIAKSRGRGATRGFRKGFTEFWVKLMDRLRYTVLFADNGSERESPLDTLVVWLVAMSSSVFRPFRHTATAAALALLSCLCDIGQATSAEWSTANRQRDAELKKLTGRKTAKVNSLETRVEELHRRKMQAEAYMNDLFDSVFVHRYRDSDGTIRMECIRELGMWIYTFPDMYLDPSYLRYLGWMLSDKVPAVRCEALKALKKLYENDAMVSGLRAFTERFRVRIMEMAMREKESSVRIEAVAVVARVAMVGLLEDEEREEILGLICDEDAKVRAAVAELVAEVWKEEWKEEVGTAVRAANIKGTVRDDWMEVKAFCAMTVRLLEVIDEKERSKEVVTSDRPVPVQPTPQQSQTQTQSLFTADESHAMDVDEDSLTQDEIDERRNALRERENLIEWFVGDAHSSDTKIGYPKIAAAVSTLWTHIEVLSNWQTMCDYVAQDLSEEDDCIRLSNQEETCLLYTINASISCTLDRENPRDKRKKPTAANIQDMKMAVSRDLIRYIPKLIKRYGGEYSPEGRARVIEVLTMIRALNLEVYLELRMVSSFDALLGEVTKIFIKHSELDVLDACVNTCRYLMGVDGDKGEDENSSSLCASAKNKVEELAETVIGEQVVTSLSAVELDLENQQLDIGRLFALRNAVRRVVSLEKIADFGGVELDYSKSAADESVGGRGAFGMMNAVVNTTLAVVAKRQSYDLGEEEAANVGRVLDGLLAGCLECMCLDAVWELRKAFADVLGDDISSLTEGGDRDHVLPSPTTIQAAEEKVHGFKAKTERLIPIVEAIVAGSSEEWISFGIGMRIAAFKVLNCLYLAINGDAGAVFHIGQEVPEDVQEGLAGLMERIVELVVGGWWDGQYTINSTASVVKRVGAEEREVVRHEVLQMTADFGRLLVFDLIDTKYTVSFLKYFGAGSTLPDSLTVGGGEGVFANGFAVVDVFGGVWDGLSEEVLKEILGTRVATAVDQFLTEGDVGPKAILNLRDRFTQCTMIIGDALIQSMELYFLGRMTTINPSLNLAKCLIGHMKSWIVVFNDAKQVHGIVLEGLLELLGKGVKEMVQHVVDWGRAHGQTRIDLDESPISGRSGRRELEEVNEGWRVWGSIGGVVQQFVKEFGMVRRNEDDEGAFESVEDVVEFVQNELVRNGFNPAEGEREWSGYLAFVKQLEKGDSSVKKRGRKPKALISREGAAAVIGAATKPKRKRGPTKANRKNQQDEEEEEEAGTPQKEKRGRPSKPKARTASVGSDDDGSNAGNAPSTPRRRSTRAAAPKRTYVENDEDSNEDEEMLVEYHLQEAQSDSENERDEGESSPLFAGDTTPRSTPRKKTYSSHRKVRTPQSKSRRDDGEVTPQAPKTTMSVAVDTPKGTKRGRGRPKRTATRRDKELEDSENEERNYDEGDDEREGKENQNRSEDEGGFASSPEPVAKKRIRVG